MTDTKPSFGVPPLPADVDPSLSILAALRELREESRQRGEDTAARFDKLDQKVDKLALDDEALRLELRRLEQRQAGTDEDVRLMREEIRKDREARTTDKATMAETFDAMRRFVEESARASSAAAAAAMARFDTAAKANTASSARFDGAIKKFEAEAEARALQTVALNKLTNLARSPRFALYVALGSFVAGVVMHFVGKVLP